MSRRSFPASPQTPPGGIERFGRRVLDDARHDPYQAQGKYAEPTHCPSCDAVVAPMSADALFEGLRSRRGPRAAMAHTLYAPAVLRRPTRDLLLAGALGNALIVAMWFISRFVGIPFFGPGAGEREPIGTLDVVCTSVEIVLTVMLVAELWFGLQEAQRHSAGANQVTLKHTTA